VCIAFESSVINFVQNQKHGFTVLFSGVNIISHYVSMYKINANNVIVEFSDNVDWVCNFSSFDPEFNFKDSSLHFLSCYTTFWF
jgi:hypothetical protein